MLHTLMNNQDVRTLLIIVAVLAAIAVISYGLWWLLEGREETKEDI